MTNSDWVFCVLLATLWTTPVVGLCMFLGTFNVIKVILLTTLILIIVVVVSLAIVVYHEHLEGE